MEPGINTKLVASRRYVHTHSNADTYTHANPNPDTNSYAYADSHPNTYSDTNAMHGCCLEHDTGVYRRSARVLSGRNLRSKMVDAR